MNRKELIKVLRTAENGEQMLSLVDKLVTLVEKEENSQTEQVINA